MKISFCWKDAGHMLVAKVAQLDLLERNPEAFYLAQNITNFLNPISHGKIKSFVESASWPDDLKANKLGMLDNWHFINVPLYTNNNTLGPIPYSDNDGPALIKSAREVLSNWSSDEINDFASHGFEKSFMLRYLVHVIGDIHQPLHSIKLVDEKLFPKGDQGGNLFLINYTSTILNLHRFFDTGADGLPDQVQRPLDTHSSEMLTNLAEGFMEEYPVDPNEKDYLVVEKWINEGTAIAKDFIYKEIQYKGTPSDSYKKKGFEVIKQRICRAGFRLARIIEEIYQQYVNAKKKLNSSHFLK